MFGKRGTAAVTVTALIRSVAGSDRDGTACEKQS